MTREEAAKTLTELWGVDYHYYLTEKEAEAVDMAIEALRQVPYRTIMGYDTDELMFVAILMRQELITPDDLHQKFEDLQWMYAKIHEQFHNELRNAMESMVTTIGKDEVSVKIGGNKDGFNDGITV